MHDLRNIPKIGSSLTLLWPIGCHPKGFFSFSREWGELLFQTDVLTVGKSLEHLSMKKFSDRSYSLGLKIRKREGAEVVALSKI